MDGAVLGERARSREDPGKLAAGIQRLGSSNLTSRVLRWDMDVAATTAGPPRASTGSPMGESGTVIVRRMAAEASDP